MPNNHISSPVLEIEKRTVTSKQEGVKSVTKNKPGKNVNKLSRHFKPRNLIPTNCNQFIFTMLSSQEKWDLVFEKLIEAHSSTTKFAKRS